MQKTQKSRVSRSNHLISFLLLLGVTASVCMFIYPEVSDAFLQLHSNDSVAGYIADMDSLSEVERLDAKEQALSYNASLAEEQLQTPFLYQGADVTDTAYEACLSQGEKDEMCYIEIPEIQVYLPVAHGTVADKLRYECGHMYGTSLPVGGSSSHAVIAGHTGLRSAKIFTDLTDLEIGDYFYIHVLGEIHGYRIEEMQTVLPEEADAALQIQKGRDLITLYTCTPYGINDHRLLVRGARVYPDINNDESQTDQLILKDSNHKAFIRLILLCMLPTLILLEGFLVFIRKKQ